jgi:hypothetical protein
MFFPNRETVERVKKEYPAGTRVELVKMDDFQAPPIGTKGTVRGVDDTASIMVAWDNGSSLNVERTVCATSRGPVYRQSCPWFSNIKLLLPVSPKPSAEPLAVSCHARKLCEEYPDKPSDSNNIFPAHQPAKSAIR